MESSLLEGRDTDYDKLTRRCNARAATLHVEVARLEEAAAKAEKDAARSRLCASAMRMATDEQRDALFHNRHELDTLLGSSRKKKKNSWMAESEAHEVCRRRLVLEAARASRRNEEVSLLAVNAAKREHESAMREHDLHTAIKEERAKLIALKQQVQQLSIHSTTTLCIRFLAPSHDRCLCSAGGRRDGASEAGDHAAPRRYQG